MSLSKDDWQKQLAKVKNAGLRIVGTGITKTLVALNTAENNQREDRGLPRYHIELEKAYAAVVKQCDEVTKKHRKLFTEACAYLDGVKVEATEAWNEFKKQRPRYEDLFELRTAIRELEPKLAGAKDKDVKVLLNRLEVAIKKAAEKTDKLKPVLEEFRKGRKTWDLAKTGAEIKAKVATVLKSANNKTF